jgi:hypothetical protein
MQRDRTYKGGYTKWLYLEISFGLKKNTFIEVIGFIIRSDPTLKGFYFPVIKTHTSIDGIGFIGLKIYLFCQFLLGFT